MGFSISESLLGNRDPELDELFGILSTDHEPRENENIEDGQRRVMNNIIKARIKIVTRVVNSINEKLVQIHHVEEQRLKRLQLELGEVSSRYLDSLAKYRNSGVIE